MYSSPWAKFMTPSRPKMTVRPSASSPSAAPKTRPCRSCGSRTATAESNHFFLIRQGHTSNGAFSADPLAADVRVLDAHALVGLGYLVGVERLGLLDRRRPEQDRVVGAGGDVGVGAELLLEAGVVRLHVRVRVVRREVVELDEPFHRLGDRRQILLEQEAVDPGQLVLLGHAKRMEL